jgi:hypothetical protein
MPGNSHNPPLARMPILDETEVTHRMLRLGELQSALSGLGIECVLARNHRLVLRYNTVPCEPSGLTNPELHIFTPRGTTTATTDGTTYLFGDGRQLPAGNPAAAAALIAQPASSGLSAPSRQDR